MPAAGSLERLARVRFLDPTAIAVGLAQEDGGWRVPVRHALDIHGH